MTPERRDQLLARYSAMSEREIGELVVKQLAGIMTAEAVTQAISEIAEIHACIVTTYKALGGAS